MDTRHSDSLRLDIQVPAVAAAGEAVPVRLRLKNEGAEPAVVYLRGRKIAFDVVVTRAGGDTVWQRLEKALIPAILQVRRLAPGEELVLDDRWDQRDRAGEAVAPGDYRVSGALLTDRPEPMVTGSVPLHISR
jgi:hypothetical protein